MFSWQKFSSSKLRKKYFFRKTFYCGNELVASGPARRELSESVEKSAIGGRITYINNKCSLTSYKQVHNTLCLQILTQKWVTEGKSYSNHKICCFLFLQTWCQNPTNVHQNFNNFLETKKNKKIRDKVVIQARLYQC